MKNYLQIYSLFRLFYPDETVKGYKEYLKECLAMGLSNQNVYDIFLIRLLEESVCKSAYDFQRYLENDFE